MRATIGLKQALTAADSVIHLGAGRCRELPHYLAVPNRRITLVEANPKIARTLHAQVRHHRNVQVLNRAVGERAGSGTLHVYSLRDRSSLRRATGLLDLYPGLRLVEEIPVQLCPVRSLLAELDVSDAREVCLIVDTPGEERSVLEGMIHDDVLETITSLVLRCPSFPMYHGGSTIREITRLLEAHHFKACDAFGSADGNDAEPELMLVFRLDRRSYKKQVQRRTDGKVELLQQTVKQLRRNLDSKRHELEKLKETLYLTVRLQLLREGDLRELQQRYRDLSSLADLDRSPDRIPSTAPIRTVHHFACTGGTLLCKCIASMPNTQLLSEIAPFSSRSGEGARRRFSPTDLIYRLGDTRLTDTQDLIAEVFLRGLSAIYDHCCAIGSHLVIRDHAHSHFCTDFDYSTRVGLGGLLAERFPTLSILTVRHPLDSYLSLHANAWIHFSPPTLDEYCRRYLAFLNAYGTYPRFRYEDFVAKPEVIMMQICDALELTYSDNFKDVFPLIELSGDSGRRGSKIEARSRRAVPPAIAREVEASTSYTTLCAELGYDLP